MIISKKQILFALSALFVISFLMDAFFVFSASFPAGNAPSASQQKEVEFIIDGREPARERITLPEQSLYLNAAPAIDREAASISAVSCIGQTAKGRAACQSFPPEIWVFLLAAFLALLAFNLSFDFGKTGRIHFVLEALYLLATLFVWYRFDGCRANIWFPLYVMKLGLIIYLFYLYMFILNRKPPKLSASE